MGHLIFTITREGRDDLVATRRLYRAYFVGGVVVSITFSILTENVWNPFYEGQLTFIKPLVVFPLALWFTLWLTRIDLDNMAFEPDPSEISKGGSAIDPRDGLLLEKLRASMEMDKIYRETGMTIRKLAEHLETPEHRPAGSYKSGSRIPEFFRFPEYLPDQCRQS